MNEDHIDIPQPVELPAPAPVSGSPTRMGRLFRAARRGASSLDYMIVAAIIGLVGFAIMNNIGDAIKGVKDLAVSALGTIGF